MSMIFYVTYCHMDKSGNWGSTIHKDGPFTSHKRAECHATVVSSHPGRVNVRIVHEEVPVVSYNAVEMLADLFDESVSKSAVKENA